MCQVRSFTLSIHLQVSPHDGSTSWQLTRREGLLAELLLMEGDANIGPVFKRCQAELGIALADVLDEVRCPTL